MSRKLRLANTRSVLSDLDDSIKKTMSADVEELTKFAVGYKSALLEVQCKIAGMIRVIDADQFPDDKRLQGQILELEDVIVPSLTENFNQLRENVQKELSSLQTTISECFDRMAAKVKSSGGDDDANSVLTASAALGSDKRDLVLGIVPVVETVTSKSAQSSTTVTPVRPTTAPPSEKRQDVEEKEPQRPMTAAAIRKAVIKSSKNKTDIENLLEDVVKIDAPLSFDEWNNEGIEDDHQEMPSPTEDDEINPWDSVSNVGSPDFLTAHTTSTVPINPVRVTLSNLKESCGKIVIHRRQFTERQEISNVICDWIDGQYHPYKFWLRVSGPEYDALAEQIEKHKSQIRLVSPDAIEKKLYCLAKYQGCWYRAYVTNVFRDSVIVLFIDYGNMERISWSEIAHLPSEYAKLEWQAFWVALCLVKPLSKSGAENPNQCDSWSSGVFDFLKATFQDSDAIFDCRIMAVPKKLPAIVNIRMRKRDKSVFLHKELVERGLAHRIDPSEQLGLLSIPVASTSAAPSSSAHIENVAQKQTGSAPVQRSKETTSKVNKASVPPPPVVASCNEKPVQAVLPQVEPTRIVPPRTVPSPSEAAQTVPAIRSEQPLHTPTPSAVPTASSYLVVAFNSAVIPNSLPIDLCPVLPVGREFNVKITEFTSADDFSVQLAEGSYLQSKLFVDQDLAKKCCDKQDATARIGRYVVYRSPNRSVYARGKIVAIAKNGLSLDILDVDTGIVDTDISFPGEVGCLPKEFRNCNRVSIRASLDRSDLNSASVQLRSDFENFFKLRISGRLLSALISPQANVEKVSLYRTCAEPLPLLIHVVEGARKVSLGSLIFTSDETLLSSATNFHPTDLPAWKFDDEFLEDDGDNEDDDLNLPSNPDVFLLGFEPKDDQEVCKHFRRSGYCPRGEYCTFKHLRLPPYRSTIETEEYGLVPSMELEPNSRVCLRLCCDWQTQFTNALQHYPTTNVIPIWFQLPLGEENWLGREEELLHEMEVRGDVTTFEEPYLEMEIDLTNSYSAMEQACFIRPKMIPTPKMHVAVRVSTRLLGAGDEDDDQRLVWVRGIVLETLRDDNHARVQFFDYGNEAVVSAEHIRPLEDSFANRLPSLAMMFSVNRQSAERFFSTFPTSNIQQLVAADIVESDNQSSIPIVKLVTISRGNRGVGTVVREF